MTNLADTLSHHDGLVRLDDSGRIQELSLAAADLLGQTADALLNSAFAELFDDAGRVASWLQVSQDAGAATVRDLQPRGARHRLNGRAFAMLNAEGQSGLIVTLWGVQPREEEAGLFRGLLESAPDAMVIANQAGNIVLVNSRTEQLFGYARQDLLGLPVEMLIPNRFRAGHAGFRDAFFQQPRLRPMGEGRELYGQRRDGSEFPVEISLSPLKTADGMLVSASIRDITERHRFEKALQDKNLELEQANQAKDRFLASMSHELRTPLNAIIGFTGTLLMKLPGPLTADQTHQLKTIQSSARHLLSIINDLLDLARIESGKVEIYTESVNLGELLQDIQALLLPAAEAKQLNFALNLPEAEICLQTDRRMLKQILLNLANNAIKFTETGGISLTAFESGPKLLLQVADTGLGIPEAQQSRLFAAFARIKDSAHTRIEGTGLGLHLSQKFAHLLGGEIDCESQAGTGSTFTLTLRRDPCPPAF